MSKCFNYNGVEFRPDEKCFTFNDTQVWLKGYPGYNIYEDWDKRKDQ